MKYEIWQVSEAGFVPCNQLFGFLETDNLEGDDEEAEEVKS